jgi:NADH:ubiquinone oxidoreductase subunit E
LIRLRIRRTTGEGERKMAAKISVDTAQASKEKFQQRSSSWLLASTQGVVVSPPKELEQFFEEGGLAKESLEELTGVIARYQSKPGSLIPVLQRAQEIVGYLPPAVQRYVASGLRLSPTEVYGVVTFYSYFTMVPRGRHTIRVCMGTACYLAGAGRLSQRLENELEIPVGQTTKDRRFTLETVRCVGCCSLAPVVLIGEDVHQQLVPQKVTKILDLYE